MRPNTHNIGCAHQHYPYVILNHRCCFSNDQRTKRTIKKGFGINTKAFKVVRSIYFKRTVTKIVAPCLEIRSATGPVPALSRAD